MNTNATCWALLLCCVTAVSSYAQDKLSPSIHLGDPAPPLIVRQWLKGKPVKDFEKGKVYVIEFWATWCRPCLAAMPHLSKLANQYKDQVSFIAMDVMENKNTSLEQVKAVVDRMGQKMDLAVAVQDSNFMEVSWLEATGENNNGIPRTFVVDKEGKLAWVGHPMELEEVLHKVVNNTWNSKDAEITRSENRRLAELDRDAVSILMEFESDQFKPGSITRPDSILYAISEIVRKEPKLKFAPRIAHSTFRSLLLTDMNKAYEYGKEVLKNPTYTDPAYNAIISNIYFYSTKINLPAKLYELGAEACQLEIDYLIMPEMANMANMYSNMATMYWKGNNKAKAIEAQQKAIEALKHRQAAELAEYNLQLQQYKKQ
jgi:thiol-disulfide isomerase/thioredoxin